MIELEKPYTQYEGAWVDVRTGASMMFLLVKYLEHQKTSDNTTHVRYLTVMISENVVIKFWINDGDILLNFFEPTLQNLRDAIRTIFL